MTKIGADTPKAANPWLHENLSPNELAACRQAFCKYLKYKGILVKDAKLDLEMIKNVAYFMGNESQKWRHVSPHTMSFKMKGINSVYNSLLHFTQSPEEAQEMVEDLQMPDAATLPRACSNCLLPPPLSRRPKKPPGKIRQKPLTPL